MRELKKYRPGTPEWTLVMFFKCWKRRAWIKILDYVQPSWVVIWKEPNKWIRFALNAHLIDTKLVQRNNTTPAVAEYLIEIKYREWRQHETKTVVAKVRLIRERKRWGVIPGSVGMM